MAIKKKSVCLVQRGYRYIIGRGKAVSRHTKRHLDAQHQRSYPEPNPTCLNRNREDIPVLNTRRISVDGLTANSTKISSLDTTNATISMTELNISNTTFANLKSSNAAMDGINDDSTTIPSLNTNDTKTSNTAMDGINDDSTTIPSPNTYENATNNTMGGFNLNNTSILNLNTKNTSLNTSNSICNITNTCSHWNPELQLPKGRQSRARSLDTDVLLPLKTGIKQPRRITSSLLSLDNCGEDTSFKPDIVAIGKTQSNKFFLDNNIFIASKPNPTTFRRNIENIPGLNGSSTPIGAQETFEMQQRVIGRQARARSLDSDHLLPLIGSKPVLRRLRNIHARALNHGDCFEEQFIGCDRNSQQKGQKQMDIRKSDYHQCPYGSQQSLRSISTLCEVQGEYEEMRMKRD